MRRLLGLFAIAILSLVPTAQATTQPQQLILLPGSEDLAPALRLIVDAGTRIELEFTLPALQMEDIAIEGQSFQALAIAGGGLVGEEGRAALPTFSRLVAVPAGMAVSARVVASEEAAFAGYRPLPMQPADAKTPLIDRAWYAGGEAQRPPLVQVGEPAIMHGQRLVPISVNPVSWSPASGTLTVASRVQVELEFSGSDARATPRERDYIPESFDNLFRDTLLGYRAGEAQVGPGTYLVIVMNDASMLSAINPLLEWRRQQGYNVVVETNGTSSTTVIKNSILTHYNNDDPPLEFVTIVGDATGTYGVDTFHESYSGYGGEGDNEYSLLEGGDWLPDVHVGRLSCDSPTNLTAIVAKILSYEQTPPTTDAGWFGRGVCVGDPGASGITCVWVNQWLADQLWAKGYTSVTEIYSGNFATQMVTAINNGCSTFGYRGYYNMSGLTESGILATSNSGKLPYAVIPTCGTGSFEETTCRSEAFLKDSNGGGIGAVGTATLGTHTRYNNCYFMGNWEGVINGSDHRIGVGHTRGKVELFNNYINYETNQVYIWSTWNNLMGDPATDMWTGYPGAVAATYPATVPVGANSISVHVTSGGSALAGALVSLYKTGELRSVGYTDAGGNVNLPVSGVTAGTLDVTVTKHDYFPHRGTLTLGSVGSYLAFGGVTIDDDTVGSSSGNGDHLVNPGEMLELPVALHNLGTTMASSVTATISTGNPYVTVIDGAETYANIAAGATVWSAEDFDVAIAPSAPDGAALDLDLKATSGAGSWTSLVRLTVMSAAFNYQSFTWSGGGGTLDPGETGSFTVSVQNTGSVAAGSVTATLASASPWITITDAAGSYGTVGIGGSATNTGNPFAFSVSSDCFQGHLATFTLTLSFDGGRQDVVEFNLPVGAGTTDDPLGPDAYGYYAFDNTDTGYPWAPTYAWVEISSVGTDANLTDLGWEQDDTNLVNLPFTFTYYGQDFTQISICSNGWIAMGATDMVTYRNWSIPAAGNPDAMIAGFFDNLYLSASNRVYTWYDSDNHRFVIQYDNVHNDYSNATEKFEIILYDPSYWATVTGDGPILVQYMTVGNTDARDGYATVGITSLDGSDGLLYTYASDYAPTAASLTSGRAILFQPIGDLALGTLQGDLTNTSNGGTPVANVGVHVVENNQTLLSATDGHYAGSVQEGVYTMRVEHESFATVTVTGVNIVEDQVTELDFQLTDILGPYITNVTVHEHTENTAGPYVIEANIEDFSAISEMHFRYKLNGGGNFEVPLVLIDAGSGLYRAEIPGLPLSTQISYWLEAEDVASNASRNPAVVDTYYNFYVVESHMVADHDLETDQGWTVGQAGDAATTGIWTRVDPIGVYAGGDPVQPEDDVSDPGTMCYITGNAETGSQGADDVDGGQTTLLTPWFDLSEMLSATVSYYFWYVNDTGSNPDEDHWLVEITDDDVSWVELEYSNVSTHAWVQRSFNVADYVDLTSTVRLRFVASDFGGGSIVEAGIDEFLLSGFLTPDPTAVDEGAVPATITLLQNVPNPFNPKTEIRFGLPAAATADLKVFDATGRLVRTLLAGAPIGAGFHRVSWDGTDDRGQRASTGVYFYVLETGAERQRGKMLLLK